MALDYFDRLAEAAVKDAIQELVASGKRPSGRTVPPDAQQLLRQRSRARLSEADGAKKVQQAIERLAERKEIKAPKTPNSDWAVIDQNPPAKVEAAKGRSLEQ
jgi:hypothetical protein